MNDQPFILLVDDDPDDLMLIRDAIESIDKKYDFVEAYDGRSALNQLREMSDKGSSPSLVILDINMPILDGREMLAIMKSDDKLRNINVVVFTTSSNPNDINYCKQFNVTLFSKPFNITMLKDVAKKILEFCQ